MICGSRLQRAARIDDLASRSWYDNYGETSVFFLAQDGRPRKIGLRDGTRVNGYGTAG